VAAALLALAVAAELGVVRLRLSRVRRLLGNRRGAARHVRRVAVAVRRQRVRRQHQVRLAVRLLRADRLWLAPQELPALRLAAEPAVAGRQ
jgi:hypothetical protein